MPIPRPANTNRPARTPHQIRRAARSWMLFDWANQPFYTLIISFIFGPYFVAQVAADPVAGQATWATMNTFAALSVALLAPLLGAIADQTGARKPWIAGFSGLFMVGCAGLWLAVPGADPLWPILILFVIAFIGSEFALIFTNAMLPDLCPPDQIGRISGSGWAMGYAGGVVSLLLVLALMAPAGDSAQTLAGMDPIFGLDPATGAPERATGPLTALWFAVFALPLFFFVPDVPRRMGLRPAARAGVRQLGQTLRQLPSMGPLFRYLIAAMLYRDGLAGLFAFGAIYASGVLGWGTTQLGIFGIVAALTGVAGAFLGGRADSALGPKPVIVTSILVLIGVSAVALTTNRGMVVGVPLGPDSGLPDLVFLACGGALGAAAGALQSASRTLLIVLAQGRLAMTEAFGLYALSGKATAFLAPAMIGLATSISGNQAIGVSPVILLFAAGLVLLYWTKIPNNPISAPVTEDRA